MMSSTWLGMEIFSPLTEDSLRPVWWDATPIKSTPTLERQKPYLPQFSSPFPTGPGPGTEVQPFVFNVLPSPNTESVHQPLLEEAVTVSPFMRENIPQENAVPSPIPTPEVPHSPFSGISIEEEPASMEVEEKLQASKSPIIDSLVYCALKDRGITLFKCEGDNIQFKVTDFEEYYKSSAQVCAKQHPTDDEASRVKALKRWFPDFPTKRERAKLGGTFLITVQKPTNKDNKPKKLRSIIEKNRALLKGIQKVHKQR